jgi:hypothetical protein
LGTGSAISTQRIRTNALMILFGFRKNCTARTCTIFASASADNPIMELVSLFCHVELAQWIQARLLLPCLMIHASHP